MASPPPGSPQQTRKWAESFQSNQRPQSQNTAAFGFGQQAARRSMTRPGRAQSQPDPFATSVSYNQPARPAAQSNDSRPSSQPYQAYSPANQQAQAPAFQQQMPSFQFTGGTDWMGNQYTDPNAMMAQAGAMAQALNQQRQGMMEQGQFGSLNPQMAYNQGMGMLQQGWQNPFAQQPALPQFQDPGNNIRDLIQGPPPVDAPGQADFIDNNRDGRDDRSQAGPGKPDPTPRLPAGLYLPERIATDRGPDWYTNYYNPSTGETFQSYKNTVRPEEGSGWVNQGRERGSQAGPATAPGQVRPVDESGFTYPGQAQPVQDPYDSSTPYQQFVRDYESGGSVGDVWGQRRNMGQAAPPESFWAQTNDLMAGRRQDPSAQEPMRYDTSKPLPPPRPVHSTARPQRPASPPRGPSATEQWNRIQATTNTQTKPLSPAHQRVYQAMVDEQMNARGRGDTWAASGSPIANMGRAMNAQRGTGFTGIR